MADATLKGSNIKFSSLLQLQIPYFLYNRPIITKIVTPLIDINFNLTRESGPPFFKINNNNNKNGISPVITAVVEDT